MPAGLYQNRISGFLVLFFFFNYPTVFTHIFLLGLRLSPGNLSVVFHGQLRLSARGSYWSEVGHTWWVWGSFRHVK
jgi:hypothetical protein